MLHFFQKKSKACHGASVLLLTYLTYPTQNVITSKLLDIYFQLTFYVHDGNDYCCWNYTLQIMIRHCNFCIIPQIKLQLLQPEIFITVFCKPVESRSQICISRYYWTKKAKYRSLQMCLLRFFTHWIKVHMLKFGQYFLHAARLKISDTFGKSMSHACSSSQLDTHVQPFLRQSSCCKNCFSQVFHFLLIYLWQLIIFNLYVNVTNC